MNHHLRVVRTAAWEVRGTWRPLGVQLGVNEGTLDVSALLCVYNTNLTLYSSTSNVYKLPCGHASLVNECMCEHYCMIFSNCVVINCL